MSKALDLLNSLTDEEIAQLVAQPDPEGHIIVGGDRVIRVPANLRRIGVEHDHNIETVTFDCPRYWDIHDLSQMAIYINYRLANGYTDRYPVEYIKVEADGDVMHFDWTISRNVTQVRGSVSFMVCAVKTEAQRDEDTGELIYDEDGKTILVEVLHWNSELNQEMYVSEGMECEEAPIDVVSDIVAAMLERYQTEEAVQQMRAECMSAVENCEILKNAASRANTQVQQQAAEIRNSYANAIKGNVSGEIVRVDDVSPLQHDVKCWVHGKNLFDATRIPLGVGVTNNYVSAVGEGLIEITSVDPYDGNGHISSTVKLKELCPQMRPGRRYTLSATTDAFNKCMYLAQLDYFWQFNTAVTVTEEMLECGAGFYGYAPYRGQEHGTCKIYDIQIEEGSIATAYEPYVDPTIVNLSACGKNLWHTQDRTYPFTQLGLTVNYDEKTNVYSFNGVSTSASNIYVVPDNILNLKVKKGSTLRFRADVVGGTSKDSDGGTDVTKHIAPLVATADYSIIFPAQRGELVFEEDVVLSKMYFYVYKADITFNKLSMKIQLEYNESTEFERYVDEVVVTPSSSDGTCTVRSVSPTMTVFTDTPGVIVEAEYNRDTTKMFESYVLTPEAKTEIAALVESDLAEVLSSLNDYAVSLTGGGS